MAADIKQEPSSNEDLHRLRELLQFYEMEPGNLIDESFSFVATDNDVSTSLTPLNVSPDRPYPQPLPPPMIEEKTPIALLQKAHLTLHYPTPTPNKSLDLHLFPNFLLVDNYTGTPIGLPEPVKDAAEYSSSVTEPVPMNNRQNSPNLSSGEPCIKQEMPSANPEHWALPSISNFIPDSPVNENQPEIEEALPPRRGRPRKNQQPKSWAQRSSAKKVHHSERDQFKENQPGYRHAGTMMDGLSEEESSDEMIEERSYLAEPDSELSGQDFGKPPYSYSAMVALAIKNSKSGKLTVRDIYNFMCHHFPYFRTAPAGWKNSVRHNLSLNPAFLKILGHSGPARSRTACRWTIDPEKLPKLNEDLKKHSFRSEDELGKSMRFPEQRERLELGKFSDFRKVIMGSTVQPKEIPDCRMRSSSKIKSKAPKKTSLKRCKKAPRGNANIASFIKPYPMAVAQNTINVAQQNPYEYGGYYGGMCASPAFSF